MAFETASPAQVPVLGADAAGRDLLEVARGADIVVAGRGAGHLACAGEAVVARLGGDDGVAAYVALGGEGEGFEGADIHYAWACEDRC